MNRTFDSLRHAQSSRLTDGAEQAAAPPRLRPAAPEQALFRFDLKRSLRMHRRLALGFALAGVVLAALYVARNWHVYTAQSLVYIQPTPSAVLEEAPMHWPYNYDPATYDSYIQQQMLSMTRPDVLAGAAKRLDPGVWPQSGDESDAAAATQLKGMVEVARVGTSYQVAITAHAPNPELAAALANALAASYIENTSHEQMAGDAERLTMLREERDRIKKELDDDRTEQAALNAQLGVAAIGPEAPEHYDSDIAQIHEELVKARSDHDEAAARLTSMNSGGPDSAALDAEADQMIATDPGLSSLKQAMLTRRATLVQQMSNLTPNNPQYKQDQEEMQKIDASLASSTQELRAKAAGRIEEQLRTDLDRTSGLEARLNGELAQMTRAAAGATPKLQRASDLASDITRLQNRYNTVDEQLQNQTLQDAAPGAAHVAEAAVPPTYPSIAGVLRNALLLLIMFAGLGVAAAVLKNKLDPKVYVASDVEYLLGYAPMAQLPDFDEVRDEVAEEHLLRLASSIEYAAKDGQLRSCVFTGTGPGVGVTTIAARVKEMLGALGKETILVDAAGPVPVERRTATGTELARSGKPTALAAQKSEASAAENQSLLLTDTAPLTVSAEAEYMARRADCTILVIESGATTRAQLRAAAKSLQRLNSAAVGFVLNRVSLANADESFRNAVSEVERHLRVQGRTTARTVAQGPRLVTEPEPMSTAREIPVLAEKAVAPMPWPEVTPAPFAQPAPVVAAEKREALSAPKVAAALREIDPVSLSVTATPAQPQHKPVVVPMPERMPVVAERRERQPEPGSTPFLSVVPREIEPVSMPAAKTAATAAPQSAPTPVEEPKAQPVSWTVTPPTPPQPADETPWWLTEAPAHNETLLKQPRTPRVGTWHSVAAHGEPSPAAEARAEEETAYEAPSRLSGLKGILFSLGIKDVTQRKGAERNGRENGNGNGNGHAVPVEEAPADPDRTMVLDSFTPRPEHEPVQANADAAVTREGLPRWVTAEPEFLPPPADVGKALRWNYGSSDIEGLEDVQILPARRGQYKL